MLNQIATRKQKGFTLIELVMVIVILGILAAFALPRFADLGGEARVATLAGASGSVKSAAAIAHSKWLATGKTAPVPLEGAATDISMSPNGYPTLDSTGIMEAAQLTSDFQILGVGDPAIDVITFVDFSSDDAENCHIVYDPSNGQATVEDSGCS